MLCTLEMTNSYLKIKFHNLPSSLLDRQSSVKIVWDGTQLARIPKSIDLQVNTEYRFPIKKKTPFTVPLIIIKYQVKNNTIYLPPVISILLDPFSVPGKRVNSKKGKMIVLNQLASILTSKGYIVTAIHPENISHSEQAYIRGFIYQDSPTHSKLNWQKATFPFPYVVYNQISSRKWESLDVSMNAKNAIVDKIGNRFFNSCFLDKYISYSILDKNPSVNKYLLDVNVYDHNNLKSMIEKYNTLYVKPIRNSLGIGIWRCSKLKDGKYVFQVKKNNKIINYISKNMMKLLQFFDSHIGDRDYLIQEGIRLLKYEERIFDVRALAQKNKEGIWSLTGAGARVAAPNAYMTHVPNGGEIMCLDEILDYVTTDHSQLELLKQQLEEMAVCIPETLENELQMSFGEISMDIGIDKDFRLYLIEINAKPMRFDEKDIQEKAINKLAQYIAYLSNWD